MRRLPKAGVYTLFLILVTAVQTLFAQVERADTTLTDTSFVLIEPISLVGSIERTLSSRYVLCDSAIDLTDYKYLGDLFALTSGMFIRDLGSPGQLHGFTINGVDARSIVLMSDGIVLNEPLTGVYDPNLYPTEHIERVEVIRGTRAFLYGINATGGAINIVTKSKRALKPISRVRFSESVFGYGFLDAMISQDVLRGLNVTLGLQHPTIDGKFPNSGYELWNLRGKVRYNLSNKVNIFFSEIYNQSKLGLNGGVEPQQTPAGLEFDRFQAAMRSEDAYEKITRHDLQLGTAARLFQDTAAVSTLTLYLSSNLREYRDKEHQRGIFPIKQDHRTEWYGVKFTHHARFEKFTANVGTEIQARGTVASPTVGQHIRQSTSVYGKTEFAPFDEFTVSGYGRFDNYLNRSPVSFGSDASFRPLSWLELGVGYSHSYRFPTIQEEYWRDSVVSAALQSIAPETHNLIEGKLRLLGGQTSTLELTIFRRTIHDAIVPMSAGLLTPFPSIRFTSHSKLTLQGFDGKAEVRWGVLYGEGVLQFIEVKTNDFTYITLLPKWYAFGGLYYWNKLLSNSLDLKIGVRGKAFSAYQGMEYNPQAQMYVTSVQKKVDAVGVGDFVLLAHIGDAYVHFVLENLFARRYFITPTYPQLERTLRFGISWTFLD